MYKIIFLFSKTLKQYNANRLSINSLLLFNNSINLNILDLFV